jgi:hypothetical protein
LQCAEKSIGLLIVLSSLTPDDVGVAEFEQHLLVISQKDAPKVVAVPNALQDLHDVQILVVAFASLLIRLLVLNLSLEILRLFAATEAFLENCEK